jgi:surface-anchored protein
MKKILFMLMVSSCLLRAHDHIEVGLVPGEESFLALAGPGYQLALYVPSGEPFSGYLPQFPGGWHACELTFTTETNALEPADGADPRIEIVSVSGPPGGSFAFWEVGALEPTILLPVGWAGTDASFPVVLAGDTHAHGRCFTMDKPGVYTMTFRAVDTNGALLTSENQTITFNALPAPKLSISAAGGSVSLSFTSRANLNYDLQVCTDLASGVWANVEPHVSMNGDGRRIDMADPVAARPKAFFRLVEY